MRDDLLEVEAGRYLHRSIRLRSGDFAEAGGGGEGGVGDVDGVGGDGKGAAGGAEVGVVDDVEGVYAKLEVEPVEDLEILGDAGVEIDLAGGAVGIAGDVAEAGGDDLGAYAVDGVVDGAGGREGEVGVGGGIEVLERGAGEDGMGEPQGLGVAVGALGGAGDLVRLGDVDGQAGVADEDGRDVEVAQPPGTGGGVDDADVGRTWRTSRLLAVKSLMRAAVVDRSTESSRCRSARRSCRCSLQRPRATWPSCSWTGPRRAC